MSVNNEETINPARQQVLWLATPHNNARYTKLCFDRWKTQWYAFYGRFGQVIPLPASASIPGKEIHNMLSTKHCIEILSVDQIGARRNQGAMVPQNRIIKIIGDISGVANVISRFAVLCHGDLASAKTEFAYFILAGTRSHEIAFHIASNSPVVVDVGIVTKPDRNLARHSFLVDATDIYIGNIA